MMPLLAAVLVACAPQPEPRTVIDFMEDGFAREGVLTRCNQNRDETSTDEECANARRAAAALALEAERARAPGLEQQSEAKLVALREREDRQAAAEQGAIAAANAAAEAAYEAQFRAPGAPVGSSRSPSFDVYADGSDPLGRRSLEVAAAEPPPNELVIAQPRLEVTDLTVVPRPFRDDATKQ
jgi:hypothetical protein